MSERRYLRADDDAPLYRVSKAIGGLAWPAYRVWDEGGHERVVLDIAGDLVTFFGADVALLPRPNSEPDWVLRLIEKLVKYEDLHGHPEDQWTCFADVLEGVPAETLEYARAWAVHSA
jgi:hypothetical protein